MAAADKVKLPIEEYLVRFEEQFEHAPASPGELVMYSRMIQGVLPLSIDEARVLLEASIAATETQNEPNNLQANDIEALSKFRNCGVMSASHVEYLEKRLVENDRIDFEKVLQLFTLYENNILVSESLKMSIDQMLPSQPAEPVAEGLSNIDLLVMDLIGIDHLARKRLDPDLICSFQRTHHNFSEEFVQLWRGPARLSSHIAESVLQEVDPKYRVGVVETLVKALLDRFRMRRGFDDLVEYDIDDVAGTSLLISLFELLDPDAFSPLLQLQNDLHRPSPIFYTFSNISCEGDSTCVAESYARDLSADVCGKFSSEQHLILSFGGSRVEGKSALLNNIWAVNSSLHSLFNENPFADPLLGSSVECVDVSLEQRVLDVHGSCVDKELLLKLYIENACFVILHVEEDCVTIQDDYAALSEPSMKSLYQHVLDLNKPHVLLVRDARRFEALSPTIFQVKSTQKGIQSTGYRTIKKLIDESLGECKQEVEWNLMTDGIRETCHVRPFSNSITFSSSRRAEINSFVHDTLGDAKEVENLTDKLFPVSNARKTLSTRERAEKWDSAQRKDIREQILFKTLQRGIHDVTAFFASLMHDYRELEAFSEALRTWQQPKIEDLNKQLSDIQTRLNQIEVTDFQREAFYKERDTVLAAKDSIQANVSRLWKELVSISMSIDELPVSSMYNIVVPGELNMWTEHFELNVENGVHVTPTSAEARQWGLQEGSQVTHLNVVNDEGEDSEAKEALCIQDLEVGEVQRLLNQLIGGGADPVQFHCTFNPRNIMKQMYKEYLKNLQEPYTRLYLTGHPVEFVDGDTMEIAENFLIEVMEEASRVSQATRVLPLAVMGPQSSGKTTLLKHLFGIWGKTSPGRCTRGINISRIRVDNELDDLNDTRFSPFEDLIVIDTEGVGGVEKQSKLYDRKITLSAIACSQIVLINMGKNFDDAIREMLEVALWAFKELELAQPGSKPQIIFVMRDWMDTDQVELQRTQQAVLRSMSNVMHGAISDVIREPIWFTMPPAYSHCDGILLTNSNFVEKCVDLRQCILDVLQGNSGKNCFSQKEWVQKSIANWKTVERDGNLMSVENLLKRQQRKILRTKVTELAQQTQTKLEPIVRDLISECLADESMDFQGEWNNYFRVAQDKCRESFSLLAEEYSREDQQLIDEYEEELVNHLRGFYNHVLRRWWHQQEDRNALNRPRLLQTQLKQLIDAYQIEQLQNETEADLETLFTQRWQEVMAEIEGKLQGPEQKIARILREWYMAFTDRNALDGRMPSTIKFVEDGPPIQVLVRENEVIQVDENYMQRILNRMNLRVWNTQTNTSDVYVRKGWREGAPKFVCKVSDQHSRIIARWALRRQRKYAWFLYEEESANYIRFNFKSKQRDLFVNMYLGEEVPIDGWKWIESRSDAPIVLEYVPSQNDPSANVPPGKRLDDLQTRLVEMVHQIKVWVDGIQRFEQLVTMRPAEKLMSLMEDIEKDLQNYHGMQSKIRNNFKEAIHRVLYEGLQARGEALMMRRRMEIVQQLESEKVTYFQEFMDIVKGRRSDEHTIAKLSEWIQAAADRTALLHIELEAHIERKLGGLLDSQQLMQTACETCFPTSRNNISQTWKFVSDLESLLNEVFDREWEIALNEVRSPQIGREYDRVWLATFKLCRDGICDWVETIQGADSLSVESLITFLVNRGVDVLNDIVGPMDLAHRISTPTAVVEGCKQRIGQLIPSFTQHLQTYLDEHETRDLYFERCRGCDEKCPRCGMKCQHSAGHSTSAQKHSCVQHMPAAFMGSFFENKLKPNVFICDTRENFDHTCPPRINAEGTLEFQAWMEEYYPEWQIEIHPNRRHKEDMENSFSLLKQRLATHFWADIPDMNLDCEISCTCSRCADVNRLIELGGSMQRGDIFVIPSDVSEIHLIDEWTWEPGNNCIMCAWGYLFDAGGNKLSVLSISNKRYPASGEAAMTHSGDLITSTEGKHVIDIKLNRVGAEVQSFVLAVGACGSGKLFKVKRPNLSMIDPTTDRILYDKSIEEAVQANPQRKTILLCEVSRDDSGWRLKTLGDVITADVHSSDSIVDKYKQLYS